MAALLLVGRHLDAPLQNGDPRTRSRRFFRLGLLLSGALHLSLLFVFLSLTNRGDEGLVTLSGRAIIVPPPGSVIDRPPPPALPDGGPPPAEKGVLTPKRDFFEIPKLPDPGKMPAFTSDNPGPGGSPEVETGDGRPAPPVPPREGPYTVLEVDEPPVEIFAPKPPYPEMAREMGLTGRVVLKVLVGPDGVVRKVEIESGPRILRESAQEALYRWRFRPARVMGKPVSVWMEVPVVYIL